MKNIFVQVFIAEKKKEAEKLDDWRQFVKSHPDLTVEIIKML